MLASITEPSSFARLRRADSEMKHPKNKGFCGMFLRSAVAPDAGVNLGDDGRQFKGSRKTHFFAREPHKVYPIYAGVHLPNTQVDSSIRRYRARFC